jgi:beta-1,4-N-acetylglucosaminyltransferase
LIFVTVGTTNFDGLIRAVDRAKEEGLLVGDVLCQIGSGSYIPRFCSYFRFRPSIDDLLEQASLVITHGGTTVLSLLVARKPFIAVANTVLSDDHQTTYLNAISQIVPIVWGRDPERLSEMLELLRTNGPVSFDIPSLCQDLTRFIDE